MSLKYKDGENVPTIVLAKRLNELADVVTKGKEEVAREFVMRVPAELDRCPDLVLSQAANRLRELEGQLQQVRARVEATSCRVAVHDYWLGHSAAIKDVLAIIDDVENNPKS